MMVFSVMMAATCLAACGEVPARALPTGCDPSVMGDGYWKIWNDAEQARIDADIASNRMSEASVLLDLPSGTAVDVEQLDSDFRFGAHIFNFNQLGKTEWNDAYKASYGAGGLFNQATVAFYWNAYEPSAGHLRAYGMYEDSEDFWNSLSLEAAQHHVYWRRPAPGPVIDFLKSKDVAIHGHILIWGLAKPYWIYDRYCPEREKRAFDRLGIPRHSEFLRRTEAGAEHRGGYLGAWKKAWQVVFDSHSEEELEALAPVFAVNMRKIFRKRIVDVGRDFGDIVNSWDVVNESSEDWMKYRASRTGRKFWKSTYGLMPGDYPLDALLDAKEVMSPEAKLVVNDWNVGKDFEAQVADLSQAGARIDLVGCQMHIYDTNECTRLAQGAVDGSWKGVWVGSPVTIRDRLDTMARTGRPVHVSEVTIAAPGTDARSRQVQAVLTRNIYRAWFSHPATMGITWWNTVDGGGVAGEPLVSGLFTRDLRKKPVYEALDELINREWRTKTQATVGDGGTVRFRGFHGQYRLTWTCPTCGERHKKTIHLGKAGVDADGSDVCEYVCRRFVRDFTVDGKEVTLPAEENLLDLAKIYPGDVQKGRDGTRTAVLAFTCEVPEAGEYVLHFRNDWWGRLFVNGTDLGSRQGPWGVYAREKVSLKKGANAFRFESRAGSGGRWAASFAISLR